MTKETLHPKFEQRPSSFFYSSFFGSSGISSFVIKRSGFAG
jgi:hypothetical protein